MAGVVGMGLLLTSEHTNWHGQVTGIELQRGLVNSLNGMELQSLVVLLSQALFIL